MLVLGLLLLLLQIPRQGAGIVLRIMHLRLHTLTRGVVNTQLRAAYLTSCRQDPAAFQACSSTPAAASCQLLRLHRGACLHTQASSKWRLRWSHQNRSMLHVNCSMHLNRVFRCSRICKLHVNISRAVQKKWIRRFVTMYVC